VQMVILKSTLAFHKTGCFFVFLLLCVVELLAFKGHVLAELIEENNWEEIVSEIESVDESEKHSVNDTEVRFPSKHDPFLKFTTDGVVINIGVRGPEASTEEDSLHPMSAEHFIEYLYVKDQNGRVIHLQKWTAEEAANEASKPKTKIVFTKFELREDVTHMTPYSLCNLHGLWKGPEYDVLWEKKVAFVQGATRPNTIVQKYGYHPLKEHKRHEKHVPHLTFTVGEGDTGNLVGKAVVRGYAGSIENPHDMREDHFIECIYVKDQHDRTIALQMMKPETHEKPIITFQIPQGTQTVQAYEYCQVHGLWQGKVHSLAQEKEKCVEAN